MRRSSLGILALLIVAACGEPAPSEDKGDCAIDVTLSGRINDHVGGPQHCRTTGIFDSPALRAKSWMAGPHGDFGVELFDISEGQIGTFGATLSIARNSTTPGGWATTPGGCEVTINEWQLEYETANLASYFYVGTGTCNVAATGYGKETGEITFSAFSLKNWVGWSR